MLAAMSQIPGVASPGVASASGIGSALKNQQPPSEKAPFSDLFSEAVGDVSRLEGEAQKAVEGLMTGSGVDVHQAMIATQKASMAFELSLAVRNKAVQAYQQLMGMQF